MRQSESTAPADPEPPGAASPSSLRLLRFAYREASAVNRIELPDFETFMQEVAEVYGARPYPNAALKHWVDALQEFSWAKVRAHLVTWRNSKAKPPAIADILATLNRERSDDLEREASEAKTQFKREPTPVTAFGEASLAKIKAMLASPRKPGAWWAYELRDQMRAGRVLNHAQLEMAKACGSDWDTDRPYRDRNNPRQPDRVPGEDDE